MGSSGSDHVLWARCREGSPSGVCSGRVPGAGGMRAELMGRKQGGEPLQASLCVPRLTASARFLQRPSQGEAAACGPQCEADEPPKVSSWKATDSDAGTSSASFPLSSSVTDASYSGSVNVNLLVQRWRSLALHLHIFGKWRSRDKDSDIKGPVCTDVREGTS